MGHYLPRGVQLALAICEINIYSIFKENEDLSKTLQDYYIIVNIDGFKKRKAIIDEVIRRAEDDGLTFESKEWLVNFFRASEPVFDKTEALLHIEDYAPDSKQPDYCSYDDLSSQLPETLTMLIPCRDGYRITFDEANPDDRERYRQMWLDYQSEAYMNILDEPVYHEQRKDEDDVDYLSVTIYPYDNDYFILERAGGPNTSYARIMEDGERTKGLYYDIIKGDEITELVCDITDAEAERIRAAARERERERSEYIKNLETSLRIETKR